MEGKEQVYQPAENDRIRWVRYVLIVLVAEKIVQHIFVTLAFFFDWQGIGATVAVNPQVLLVLGAIAAILFALSLWGLLSQQKWAVNLIIGLALFDIIGEFVAQGTMGIVINVSFLVATVLLILALFYRWQAAKLER
ncbi:MAG: hypothetical protein H6659_02340 [Ardenticatenaceae bacterium]|nr:hypothetical protein [Ardenticatenaceae bacterium]